MTVVSLYVNVSWVKSMCSGHIYHNFSYCDDLSIFGKEYLNSLNASFVPFFSIKLRKFWHTARLSRTNHHKVIKSENSPFFGPPCMWAVLIKLKHARIIAWWIGCNQAPSGAERQSFIESHIEWQLCFSSRSCLNSTMHYCTIAYNDLKYDHIHIWCRSKVTTAHSDSI